MARVNHTRANRARRALGGGFASLHPADREAAVVDFLADLRHLCREENFNAGDLYARADRHFRNEVNE